jgi:hypothetical protein
MQLRIQNVRKGAPQKGGTLSKIKKIKTFQKSTILGLKMVNFWRKGEGAGPQAFL